MKIRRKFCRLHGWAPHAESGIRVTRVMLRRNTVVFSPAYQCCRCNGTPGLIRAAKIKAFFRGFKLPKGMRAKTFLGDRF